MEILITKPFGIFIRAVSKLKQKCLELWEEGIFVPSVYPLLADEYPIEAESKFVSFPHFYGGVGLPTIGRILESQENLERLDSLFSEPPIVQDFS